MLGLGPAAKRGEHSLHLTLDLFHFVDIGFILLLEDFIWRLVKKSESILSPSLIENLYSPEICGYFAILTNL